MSRLPTPGSDKNNWGTILNEFLDVAHNVDGSLDPAAVKSTGAVFSVNGSGGDANGNVAIATGNATSLQGIALSGTPTDGQALQFNNASSAWVPVTLTSSGSVADAAAGTKGILTLSGDLTGSAATPRVAGIRGVAVSATAPTANQVLSASNGTTAAWTTVSPTTLGALSTSNNLSELSASPAAARTNLGLGTAATISATAGGDLTGTLPSPTVAKLKGITIGSTVPTAGQALVATSGTAADWATISGGGATDATTSTNGVVRLAGDLGGTAAAPNVLKLKGITIGTTVPSSGQALLATSATTADWGTVAGGGGASDATTSANGIVRLAGDLSGTAAAPTIAKIQGVVVSGTPATGQSLVATGTAAASWQAPVAATTSVQGGVILAGDLAGTSATPSVAKIKGITLPATAPTANQVLTATSATATAWSTPATGGSGGTFTPVAVTSSTYTAANYAFVLADATASGITVTLPAASAGAWVRVKKIDSSVNAVLVAGASSSTIDGGNSFSVNSQYMSQDFMSNGTNWYLI